MSLRGLRRCRPRAHRQPRRAPAGDARCVRDASGRACALPCVPPPRAGAPVGCIARQGHRRRGRPGGGDGRPHGRVQGDDRRGRVRGCRAHGQKLDPGTRGARARPRAAVPAPGATRAARPAGHRVLASLGCRQGGVVAPPRRPRPAAGDGSASLAHPGAPRRRRAAGHVPRPRRRRRPGRCARRGVVPRGRPPVPRLPIRHAVFHCTATKRRPASRRQWLDEPD